MQQDFICHATKKGKAEEEESASYKWLLRAKDKSGFVLFVGCLSWFH